MAGELTNLIILQIGLITPIVAAAWKDLKDREVWRGITNILIVLGAAGQILWGVPELYTYALLAGPAASWLFEYFQLWKPFDSKMLIGLTLLHASNWFIAPILVLALYGIWTITWKKHFESHCPVVPVFLLAHLLLIIL